MNERKRYIKTSSYSLMTFFSYPSLYNSDYANVDNTSKVITKRREIILCK